MKSIFDKLTSVCDEDTFFIMEKPNNEAGFALLAAAIVVVIAVLLAYAI